MEQTATGSNKVPFYPSKLQELLTSDRPTRRSNDYADTSSVSVPSISGDSIGDDDGTNSLSDKCRNPYNWLLLSSMNAIEADESTTDDQSEKGRTMTKWKSDAANGGDTGDTNQGLPASFKVAPIVLKKYCRSTTQTAESEEFFVSLSEDDTQPLENDGLVPRADESGVSKNPVIKLKKDDYDYMGAQIDKLLSMPSPKSSWKAPRRVRRHQCGKCSKSYSTEHDLKSHELSHSEGQDKPYHCNICGKGFKWVASLKVHQQKIHRADKPGGTDNEGESSSSQEESSPSKEKDVPPPEDVKEEEETKNDTAKNSLALNPLVLQPEHKKSFDLVVNKMLSSGLVSSNSVTPPVEKSSPLRRQRSSPNIKDMPSTRSTSRKERKSGRNLTKLKARNDKRKKGSGPVPEELEESASPQTPTSGRSSLRRNIQRPKWLADADLVTDYEFPRGTNAMRMGNTTPSPSPGTPIPNGNPSHSRTASTDSVDESVAASNPKSHKVEKPKSEQSPPPVMSSRDRKRKEEVVKDKDEPKPKKRVGKVKEPKKVERKKSKEGKTNEKPIKKMRASKKKARATEDGDIDISPTKQLSTNIMSLKLDDPTGENSPGKLPVEKNAQKRTESESPSSPTSKAPANRRSKRIKSLDVDEKDKQPNGIEKGANSPPEEKVENDEQMDVKGCTENNVIGDVESVIGASGESSSKTMPEEVKPQVTEGQNVANDTDTTDAKKFEDGTVNCDSEGLAQPMFVVEPVSPRIQETEDPVRPVENNVTSDITTNGTELQQRTETRNIEVIAAEEASIGVQIETARIDDQSVGAEELNGQVQSHPISLGPFFNCTNSISFADIAKTSHESLEEGETQVNLNLDNSHQGVETAGPARVACLETVTVPLICSNDEDMPILRPETSSSAAASRSDSFAERFASVDADEDMSGNSNHSTVPQAPVLSKEEIAAAATFANGFLQIPKTSKTESTGSTVPDHPDELALMDEDGDEDEGITARLHRDRSDSLSMRSCGSGSQSEKIKALEDSTSRDKRTMPEQDCLVDSDSNDSLMSEFSELAAQLSEKTDGVKFKEECLRFITTKVSANSMWLIRKELKRLKKDKNYFKFGKLSPLAAGLMHDIFCQSLE